MGITVHTPLWHNPCCTELQKLDGFQSWEAKDIQYIAQLYNQTILKSFTNLQEEFGLPKHNFCRYLQLRHALQSQTWLSRLERTEHPLMTDILNAQNKKGMISQIYITLLSRTQDAAKLPCRHRWEQDLGEIEGEDWELCLQSLPTVSVSPLYRLYQLFILHRTHCTSVLLHRWGRRKSPLCPRCGGGDGDLKHLLWRCPKLFRYWRSVTNTISSVYQATVSLYPVTCLLGAVDEEFFTPPTNMAVLRLLYIARKQIAHLWLSPHIPTTKQWIEQVNNALIKEKLTYQHRNLVNQFYKIWQPWLNTPGLVPPQLVLDRLLQM